MHHEKGETKRGAFWSSVLLMGGAGMINGASWESSNSPLATDGEPELLLVIGGIMTILSVVKWKEYISLRERERDTGQ